MIIFYGEGRLGNQVLQYQLLTRLIREHGDSSPPHDMDGSVALSPDGPVATIARKAQHRRILAAGLENLHDVFEFSGVQLYVLTRNGRIKQLVKHVLMPWLLRPLARGMRLASYVSEEMERVDGRRDYTGRVFSHKGLTDALLLVDHGYFHNARVPLRLFPLEGLSLRPSLRKEASEWLQQRLAGSACVPVFVHVRRGDYAQHSDFGLTGLMLPTAYYRAAIARIRETIQRPHFIIVSDEPDWAAREFADLSPCTISRGSEALDFAVMSLCPAGVLANSTFSLAAALMMGNPRIVLAPKYWFGFRVNQWYPPRIRFHHPAIEYVEVPCQQRARIQPGSAR